MARLNIQNYNFAFCFIWVQNLVSHIDTGTQGVSFHIHTVHSILSKCFIHQLMHKWIVLKTILNLH